MKRVIINGKNRYIGDNLSTWLSKQKPGSSLEQHGEEEDAGENSQPTEDAKFDIVSICSLQTKSEILDLALNADIIVWSISDFSDSQAAASDVSDGTWLIETLSKSLDAFDTPKQFILISTIATWARTKPKDLDDPDLGFDEMDFRTRRAHLSFREHLALEKLVIKIGKGPGKGKISCHVVCSGVQYGLGESCFHYMFKQPWLDVDKCINIYGSGKNKIPTIHMNDLSKIVLNTIDHKPTQKYIVAVDQSINTLSQITKSISRQLGHNLTKRVKDANQMSKTEEDMTVLMADLLQVNLNFEQGETLKDVFNIIWQTESGIIDNIEEIVTEFRVSRKLLPVRLAIMGPPQSGKSALARKLANEYQLHVIKAENLINHTVEQLETIIAHSENRNAELSNDDADSSNEDDGESDDADGEIDFAKELKTEIQEALEVNSNLEDELICKIFRYHLTSKKCKNQGFILDGFPKTKEQATLLFAVDEEAEDFEEGELQTVPFLPEIVIGLEASGDWLKSRVMNLPENSVQGTHNDEENFLRRLSQYRKNNNEEESPLTYFDEMEVHPNMYTLDKIIDPVEIDEDYGKEAPHPAEDPNDGSFSSILVHLRELIGPPRNYGPSAAELAEIEMVNERKTREANENRARVLKETREREEALRRSRMAEWAERLAEVNKQENEAFEAASLPLTKYLMTNVMPTLTMAMNECTKARPEDPVDFIAEYLFRHNPQYD